MKTPGVILALVLILAGSYSLAYRGLTYTKKTHEANLGGIHLQLDEKERVRVPRWMAATSIFLGVALLLNKSRT